MLIIISMFVCTLLIVMAIASYASFNVFADLFSPLSDGYNAALNTLIPIIWILIVIILVLSVIEFRRRKSKEK